LSLLKAEGIFRINAENSQEENVRDQLNRGVVPLGIDVHCLAGLIKVCILGVHHVLLVKLHLVNLLKQKAMKLGGGYMFRLVQEL
jgi:hypothetical protein